AAGSSSSVERKLLRSSCAASGSSEEFGDDGPFFAGGVEGRSGPVRPGDLDAAAHGVAESDAGRRVGSPHQAWFVVLLVEGQHGQVVLAEHQAQWSWSFLDVVDERGRGGVLRGAADLDQSRAEFPL